MKKVNMRFLSSVFVLCAFGITGANAAPSVKMLGTNTARIGSNATVVKAADIKSDTQTQQRLGSIRAKPISAGAPLTITKSANAISSGNGDESARLSLGKYIHSAGVASGAIKPTSATPIESSDEFINLKDQVDDLQISKQDVLTAGNGLSINNNVIAIDDDIYDLPNQINDIYDEIDTKVSEADLTDNYYSIEEVDALIQEQGNTQQIYDSATNTYKSVALVDEFDSAVLTKTN